MKKIFILMLLFSSCQHGIDNVEDNLDFDINEDSEINEDFEKVMTCDFDLLIKVNSYDVNFVEKGLIIAGSSGEPFWSTSVKFFDLSLELLPLNVWINVNEVAWPNTISHLCDYDNAVVYTVDEEFAADIDLCLDNGNISICNKNITFSPNAIDYFYTLN